MRLIDLDAYMNKVCTYLETGCGSCAYNEACPINEPIIEERKTGQWIEDEIHANWSDWTLYFCSECYNQFKNLSPRHYCPNCGAKMEVKDERVQ